MPAAPAEPTDPSNALNTPVAAPPLVRAQDVQHAQAVFAQWQAVADQHGLVLRPPPAAPTTCCGRGCNGCVWEGWFDAVWFWQEDAQAALRQAQQQGLTGAGRC
jgi:Oxidoreductase-like protein, N-terminal